MVRGKAGISPLTRKLLRDIREGWMSFAAIWVISTLAITLYVGIDATWRGMDRSLEEQFSVGNMADLWVSGPVSDRMLRDLEALPGVAQAQRRVSVEGTASGLAGEPAVRLVMSERDTRINGPLVLEGTDFPPEGRNLCVLQESFARAYGLGPGDVLAFEIRR